MSEKETEIWEAIASALNGTGTEEQNLLLNTWLEESERNRQTFVFLNKVKRKKSIPSEVDKEDVYERIHSGIMKDRNGKRLIWMKYGNIASVFMIISLSIALLWQKNEPVSNNIETRCPLGTKSKIILSDGTVVHMNSGSVLEYPAIFSSKLREVKLKGEAYFEVTKKVDSEFIVNAGEIAIKVFGTKFNVKNYESDKLIETTLVEGSVGIIRKDEVNGKEAMLLNPNEQAIFVKQTGKLFSRRIDADLVAIWKEGKYYFDNESFEAIVQKLEREFNIPIKIKSEELGEEIFTGMFDKNKTIYQMLDLMKRKRDFSYEEANDTIIITKK